MSIHDYFYEKVVESPHNETTAYIMLLDISILAKLKKVIACKISNCGASIFIV